jgi:exosome complex RNA-binding protein Csl4
MGATCQQCGHDLVDFGEPDADGWIQMICPASPNCENNTRRKVDRDEEHDDE